MPRQSSPVFVVLIALYAASLALVGFIAGRAGGEHILGQSRDRVDRPTGRPPAFAGKLEIEQRASSTMPAAASRPVAGLEPDTPESVRSETAHRLLDGLYARIRRARSEASPEDVPEKVANDNLRFLAGWADAIRYTSSRTIDDLGRAVRGRLCTGGLSPEETIITAYIMQWMPELTREEGLECFFRAHPDEDVALWMMMDAWRVSGLEITPSLAHLKNAAVDARTRRRLTPITGDSPTPPMDPRLGRASAY